jgi:hypothetical protein
VNHSPNSHTLCQAYRDDIGDLITTRASPPDAIAEGKQMVRGVERWYVDPWTRPNVRPKLLATMARRLGQISPKA